MMVKIKRTKPERRITVIDKKIKIIEKGKEKVEGDVKIDSESKFERFETRDTPRGIRPAPILDRVGNAPDRNLETELLANQRVAVTDTPKETNPERRGEYVTTARTDYLGNTTETNNNRRRELEQVDARRVVEAQPVTLGDVGRRRLSPVRDVGLGLNENVQSTGEYVVKPETFDAEAHIEMGNIGERRYRRRH